MRALSIISRYAYADGVLLHLQATVACLLMFVRALLSMLVEKAISALKTFMSSSNGLHCYAHSCAMACSPNYCCFKILWYASRATPRLAGMSPSACPCVLLKHLGQEGSAGTLPQMASEAISGRWHKADCGKRPLMPYQPHLQAWHKTCRHCILQHV